MFPIRFNCCSNDSILSWPEILGQWLGHLWSYCTHNLQEIVKRVSSAAQAKFSFEQLRKFDNDRSPQPPASDKLKTKNGSETKLEVPARKEKIPESKDAAKQENKEIPAKEVEEWKQLFKTDDDTIKKVEETEIVRDLKKEASIEISPPLRDPEVVAHEIEESAIKQHPEPIHAFKQDSEDPILDEDLLIDEGKSTTLSKQKPPDVVEEKSGSHRREIRRNRRWKGQPRLVPLTNPVKITAVLESKAANPPLIISPTKALAKPDALPAEIEPIFIECGGAGDCQLLSLLKGLEMQHPKLLELQHSKLVKYLKDKKSFAYTDHDLRQLGVAFAREQIDTCGPYAEVMLGYLDSDRKEHNECALNAFQKRWNEEKSKLEKAKSDGKISEAYYKRRQAAITQQFTKEFDHLEQHIHIKNDEEFLKRLNNKGFSCSTVHLFALSTLLDVPIHVHDKEGTPGHNIQTFNPNGSKLEPIHLYRVRRGHYQLMFFPTAGA